MKIIISEILLESINKYYPELLPISNQKKYFNLDKAKLDKLINAVEKYHSYTITMGFLFEYIDEVKNELENLKFLKESLL